jgi:hypothetical protein
MTATFAFKEIQSTLMSIPTKESLVQLLNEPYLIAAYQSTLTAMLIENNAPPYEVENIKVIMAAYLVVKFPEGYLVGNNELQRTMCAAAHRLVSAEMNEFHAALIDYVPKFKAWQAVDQVRVCNEIEAVINRLIVARDDNNTCRHLITRLRLKARQFMGDEQFARVEARIAASRVVVE